MRRALMAAALASALALPAGRALAEDAPPYDVHTFARASIGGAVRGIYDVPMYGGEANAGVGIDTAVGAYSLAVTFFVGSTAATLLTVHGAAGIDMTWPVGILRFGLEPRIGYLGIDRLTSPRQFGGYTFGIELHGAVNVYEGRVTTLSLGIAPSADVAIAPGSDGPGDDLPAPFYGGRAFFEVRYDAR